MITTSSHLRIAWLAASVQAQGGRLSRHTSGRVVTRAACLWPRRPGVMGRNIETATFPSGQ
eukprot:12928564-Alexandrium_andersonii.AAC.1